MKNQNPIIYTPIGNAEVVGGFKVKTKELTNQQFFDALFTKYISFTLPVYDEKRPTHLEINLYSEIGSQPIKTINTTTPEDRKLVFGINDVDGFFNIPENGFSSSYQGNPVFVDLQEYHQIANFISWRTSQENKYFYSVFPLMNIDNYGNGKTIGSGEGGGSNFKYKGYFAVKDVSSFSRSIVNISDGVVYLNNKRIEVTKKDFELLDYWTGYIVDVGMYQSEFQSVDISYSNSVKVIKGRISNETIDPSYSWSTTELNYFPYELRLIISKNNEEIETYYTLNKDNRKENVTDALIATIQKNDDGTLEIIQQCFGEIERCLCSCGFENQESSSSEIPSTSS